MSRRTVSYSMVASLCVLTLLAALVLGGFGCEWGVAGYAAVGLLVLLVLLSVPYVQRHAFQRRNRMPAALGFAAAGLTAWLLGWFLVFARSTC